MLRENGTYCPILSESRIEDNDTMAKKWDSFFSSFDRLKRNRENVSLEELQTRYKKAYQRLVKKVLEGAEWFCETYLSHFCFPIDPQDMDENEQLRKQIDAILQEEREPGGKVEQYQAALIEQLDEQEFEDLVYAIYERVETEAFVPYWQKHCHSWKNGAIFNDILAKFWYPGRDGKPGYWAYPDGTERDYFLPSLEVKTQAQAA